MQIYVYQAKFTIEFDSLILKSSFGPLKSKWGRSKFTIIRVGAYVMLSFRGRNSGPDLGYRDTLTLSFPSKFWDPLGSLPVVWRCFIVNLWPADTRSPLQEE